MGEGGKEGGIREKRGKIEERMGMERQFIVFNLFAKCEWQLAKPLRGPAPHHNSPQMS
jgi:hypothetical protein